jgi:hypothetical protein
VTFHLYITRKIEAGWKTFHADGRRRRIIFELWEWNDERRYTRRAHRDSGGEWIRRRAVAAA